MTDEEKQLWDEVDAFLEEYKLRKQMSFNLEYKPGAGWGADFTPLAGNLNVRNYGLWSSSGITRADALRGALAKAREAMFGEKSRQNPNLTIPGINQSGIPIRKTPMMPMPRPEEKKNNA